MKYDKIKKLVSKEQKEDSSKIIETIQKEWIEKPKVEPWKETIINKKPQKDQAAEPWKNTLKPSIKIEIPIEKPWTEFDNQQSIQNYLKRKEKKI